MQLVFPSKFSRRWANQETLFPSYVSRRWKKQETLFPSKFSRRWTNQETLFPNQSQPRIQSVPEHRIETIQITEARFLVLLGFSYDFGVTIIRHQNADAMVL